MFRKIILGLSFLAFTFLSAQVPETISYQGILTDNLGEVVPNGEYTILFKIYNSEESTTVLWQETHTTDVNNGIINVIMGSINPLALPLDEAYWVGLTIGESEELVPRLMLNPTMYSLKSKSTEGIADSVAVRSINGLKDDLKIIGGNNVEISSAGDSIVVSASLMLSGEITGDDIDSTTTISVAKLEGGGTTETTVGVYGEHVSSGNWGEIGHSIYGVYGKQNSSGSFGILGSSQYGIYGKGGTYGAYGLHASGKWGHLGNVSYAVYGQDNSSGNYGYFGGTYGAYGEENNSGNSGLLGSSDYGVYGYSDTGTGVYGATTSGDAGYFEGDVNVTGTLSKGAGSFKIDHPLDPANKYLYHSFVESPDMMNIYNGNITLDSDGEATVELPDYFKALNGDFRYQLTAIGAPAPNLYVAEEISDNNFKIAGGEAGMKVSWMVTGVRQDAFANDHRIIPEVDKSGDERGKYLHPDENGVSETLGIGYEAQQKIKAEKEQMKANQEQMKAEQERMKLESESVEK